MVGKMTIQELEQIIDLYGKSIYSFCIQLTGNKLVAEDLYQEIWLVACKDIEKIKSSDNVKGYLLSIAVKLWKNQRRKYAWRNRIAPEEELFEDTMQEHIDYKEDTLNLCLEQEKTQMVHKAVEGLSEKYKIIVLMFYMEEMSIKDISKAMHIPEGTVKSRLNTARKYLEKELEDYINE